MNTRQAKKAFHQAQRDCGQLSFCISEANMSLDEILEKLGVTATEIQEAHDTVPLQTLCLFLCHAEKNYLRLSKSKMRS